MQLMNLVISVLLYSGSGKVSRLGTSLRLGMLKNLLLLPWYFVTARRRVCSPESELHRLWQCQPKNRRA
jgi:hypothetical protein